MAVSPGKHLQRMVGAIVVTGIIIFFIFCILFTSGFKLESYTTYQVNMTEAVSGLSPDAEVEYNGVPVGTVKDIHINKINPNIVQLLLSIKSATLITVDTVAMLKPKGLTGLSLISLTLRGNNLTPLTTKPGERYPIIPTTPSYFMQLDAMVTHFDEAFSNVKASFQALLNKDDLETMRETYYSIDHLITVLKEHGGDFSAVIRDIKLSLPYFTQLKHYKNDMAAIIDLQLKAKFYDLVDNFSSVYATLSDVMDIIKKKPTILLVGSTPPPLGPGEGLIKTNKKITRGIKCASRTNAGTAPVKN